MVTSLDNIIRTERETLKFRLLALAVVVAGLYYKKDDISLAPALGLYMGYLAYTLALDQVALKRIRTPFVVYGMIAVDALAITWGLYLAGGVQSALVILIPLLVVYYSFYFGYTSSIAAATVFSLLYGALILLTEGDRPIAPIVGVQVPFFYLLAIFGGYLSKRRIEERREKEELQEFIRMESRARGLLDVAQSLGQVTEIDQVLDRVLHDCADVLKASACVVGLLDETTGKLVARASNLQTEKLGVGELSDLPLATAPGSPAATAFEKDEPVVVGDAEGGECAQPEWARNLGAYSMMVLPFTSRGKTLGAAYLLRESSAGPFQPQEVRLAQGYAAMASSSMTNALAHRAAETKISQLVTELRDTIQRVEKLRQPRRKTELVVGDIKLDGSKGLVFKDGERVNLSPLEFEILYLLAENVGTPVNSETILHLAWGDSYHGRANVVDVAIHRLRKKLEGDEEKKRILTVRGMGYLLSPQEAAASTRKTL